MNKQLNNPMIDSMFKAGAHFGFSKTRRHPSVTPYIFGVKNKVEIFNLEKTSELLEKAKVFVGSLAKEGKTILFVGGKSEARNAVKNGALSINMPFVDGRWIGGTLTNFIQIRKRVEKLEKLTSEKEKGELAKYTKKERLLIDREIANLERFFSGIASMKELPKAIFIVDPKKEKTAVQEADYMGIPVVAISGSDCNIKHIDYPIVGNDSSQTSIQYLTQEITKAYFDAKLEAKKS
jgi:small subunit ribosomal protein S2